MNRLAAPLAILTLGLLCCNDGSVNSNHNENRSPFILSVSAFPETIGPLDSVIIVCNAMDPDADTLVYDWITDGRVNIKGALPGTHELYDADENYRVMYPTQAVHLPVDTPWVQCSVRDQKGGADARLVRFVVKQGQTEGRGNNWRESANQR